MTEPTTEQAADETQSDIHSERWELLHHIDELTETPLIALSFVWLVLLIVDFTTGLRPWLQTLSYVIWAIFVVDLLIGIAIAPSKRAYLQRNWLTVISLMLPALRVLRLVRFLRILRAARAARSVGLVRLLTSLNRGMRAISRTMGQRGISYVVALTVIVLFGGAAGMVFFESPAALAEDAVSTGAGGGLQSYGEALWWTAMLMTTIGSDYTPRTVEGRLLAWLLALYALAIFGYITAAIASYFLGRERTGASLPDAGKDQLTAEIAALRAEVAALRTRLEADDQASTSATSHPVERGSSNRTLH